MRLIVVLFCLYLPTSTLASDDEREILALYATWREAVANADIPLYVSVLHPEIRLIPPGADVIVGADHYRSFLGPVFASANYNIEVASPAKIDVLGDIAVAEYEYVIHLSLHDQAVGIDQPGALTDSRTEARYFDVLRKNAKGQWQVWRHTWQ